MAADAGAAARRLQQGAEHTDGGGLAGAIWAEQAEDLTGADAEADTGDRDYILQRPSPTRQPGRSTLAVRRSRPAAEHLAQVADIDDDPCLNRTMVGRLSTIGSDRVLLSQKYGRCRGQVPHVVSHVPFWK